MWPLAVLTDDRMKGFFLLKGNVWSFCRAKKKNWPYERGDRIIWVAVRRGSNVQSIRQRRGHSKCPYIKRVTVIKVKNNNNNF